MTRDRHTMVTRLGAFVASLSELPDAVRERAVTCLVYNVGISYGMKDLRTWTPAHDYALAVHGAQGEATMLATGRRSSLAGAASANGVVFGAAGRADTYGTIHVSNTIFSALLALMEARGLGADKFLPAMVAGYEVGCRLDRAYGEEIAKAGFRSTAVFGGIAAAAACARLIGLDAVRSASAIGLATSMTGGLLQPFSDGSDEPKLQPSQAAVLGVVCAVAAEQGALGAHRGLDGAFGLIRATTGRGPRQDEVDHDLGSTWLIDKVTFKPFPVCAFAQTPVYAGLAAREKVGDREIRELVVRLNPREAAYAGLDFTGPFKTLVEVMMSAPFAVAHGLIEGRPLAMPAVVRLGEDERLKALLQRSRLVADPQVPPMSTVVEMQFADGGSARHEQMMSAADYRFERDAVRVMVRDTIAGMADADEGQERFKVFEASADRGVTAKDIVRMFGFGDAAASHSSEEITSAG